MRNERLLVDGALPGENSDIFVPAEEKLQPTLEILVKMGLKRLVR